MLAVQLGDWQPVADADTYQVGGGSPFLHFRCALVLRGGEVAIPRLRFVRGRPVTVEPRLLVLDQPVMAGTNDPSIMSALIDSLAPSRVCDPVDKAGHHAFGWRSESLAIQRS